MTRSTEGWFEADAPCGAGARYRYRLADGLAVPDPASRAQADDVHGPSLVVDPRAYRWRHPAWRGRPWHETVLYELHAGALGGFAGVQASLARPGGARHHRRRADADQRFSRHSATGATTACCPSRPTAAYGTPDELKALIDAAHGAGS